MGFLSRLFGSKKQELIVNIPGPGLFKHDVVGESKYQKELSEICGGKTEDGHDKIVTALLIHEDTNPHDNKAILVAIDGKPVGYLDRENARQFRQRLAEAGYPGAGATCTAKIVGGWLREEGDEGHFGVKLDLPVGEQDNDYSEETPESSEFTFIIDQPNVKEFKQVKVGNSVNFWKPGKNSTDILIYRSGSVGGEGKLGKVPQKYTKIISNQSNLKLPIDTKILEVTPSSCTIHCRLVTVEEVNRGKIKRQEKLRAEISKPYRPKAPLTFYADSKSYTFDTGEQLHLTHIPSINECIDTINEMALLFSSADGKRILEKRNEPSIKKKIIRMANTYNQIQILVLAEPDKKNPYISEYKLQITPIDTQ